MSDGLRFFMQHPASLNPGFFLYICVMFRYTFSVLLFFTVFSANAQDSLWTLQRAIHYATEHNIDIRQSILNERLSRLQWQQSQLAQLPNASVSSNYGRSYGRSIDPTTNQFISAGYTFVGLNGNVDVLLFGWFQKRNTISQNQFSLKAAQADLDQIRDDISLNVATGFLRILLAKEQIRISEHQLQVSLKQLGQTEAFVESGRSPELDLAQMQAQVATDSANLFSMLANYDQAVLDIKALMNFEIRDQFVPVAPGVDSIASFTDIVSLQPEEVYDQARLHFGIIRSSELKIEAARKSLAVRKASLYPQLGLGAQFGSNYASTLSEITGATMVGSKATGEFINVNGTNYEVLQPDFSFNTQTIPFGRQINQNLRQTIALSLSIPLFNGWTARTAIAQAKIDIESKELNRDQARLKLKQEVYKAYYDASAALQKYYAAGRAAEASERAFYFAGKRYELGLMNALELLTTQNNRLKAQSDALSAKYDLIFKLKVIDYYMGKEIKL